MDQQVSSIGLTAAKTRCDSCQLLLLQKYNDYLASFISVSQKIDTQADLSGE